jgi:YjbE family integral membrane protein
LDVATFGTLSFDWNFVSGLFSIVLIDLILAGDNAVIIAMAVRDLPPKQRRKGIIFGAGAAVLLRVVLTFFVSRLLHISYLKLVGGLLILWIAVKLFSEGVREQGADREAASIVQAIKIILIADITMSTDNMLAVAGASHGNLFLLIFGLALSIPFVVFTSNLLSILMDKYPAVLYVGAAVLGRVGAEMIMTDPFVVNLLAPSKIFRYAVEVLFAIGVIVVGKLLMKRRRQAEADRRLRDQAEVSPQPEKTE